MKGGRRDIVKIAVIVAVVALSASAAVARALAERGGSSAPASPAGARVVNAAEHQAETNLLDQILRGIAGSRIVSTNLVEPPEPFDQSPGSRWLVFKIRGEEPADYLRGYWQGLIVSGLYRELAPARGLAPLYGQSFIRLRSDGTEEIYAASIIAIEKQPVEEPATASELASIIRSAAVDAHARVVDVQISRPMGHFAPAIVVEAENPAAIVARLADAVETLIGVLTGGGGKRARAEGAYVEIRDHSGRLVAISLYSVRTGHGGGRVGQDYSGGIDPRANTFGGLVGG